MSNYKYLSKEIRKSTRRDKRQYLQNCCERIEQHQMCGNDNEMFREKKLLTGNVTPRLSAIRLETP
jgi:hypothetical protein